ncbi:polysaccharide biosynthesis tyrosine autokinase [bacterium]|nr:polysaccharide biosynthesis tyrosine autokinase [bacterium]
MMNHHPTNSQNNHSPEPEETGFIGRRISFQSILFSILKRPWIMVVTLIVIMAPVTYISLNATRMYMSRSVVMVPVQETTLAITSVMGGSNDPTKPEHYYTSILQSSDYRTAVGMEVAKRMPELGPAPNRMAMGAVNFTRDPRQPGLFTLNAVSAREDLVEPFVAAAVDVFRSRISLLDQQEARAVVDFIDEQLIDLNQKTIEAEEDLQRFLREKQFVVDDPDKGIAQELTNIESSLADAEANLNLINLNLRSYERQVQEALDNLATTPDSAGNDYAQNVRLQMDQLKEEIRLAEEQGRPSTYIDSLTVLRRTLASNMMQSSMLGGAKSDMDGDLSLKNLQELIRKLALDKDQAETRVNYLRRQLYQFRQKHPNISEDILEYTRLLRKRDVLKQTLEILLEKREEARIKMAAQLGGLKVLEDPTTPAPLARHTPEKLAAALLFSLLLGVVVSFSVDYSIQTIDVDRDITDNFRVPVLGVLPPIEAKDTVTGKGSKASLESGGKLITNMSTRSWFLEALRSIKTSLFFQAAERNINCFVITSPLPSEGKSLTTANLAISVAQSGKRIIVVDCDLRRPMQHKLFDVPRKPGMSDSLLNTDSASIHDVIIPTHVNNLDIIPAGSSQHNPSELLGSQRMSAVLGELRSQYDYVLLDSPPVLPAVDSRLLGTLADGLVLIAHAERTKIRNFENALNLIRNLNVPVLGTVLNQSIRKYGMVYYSMYGYYQSYYYYKPYSEYYGSTDQEEYAEKNGKAVRGRHGKKKRPAAETDDKA